MTSISKNLYIDKLDEIVNKYNNTYHRTIRMKPVDVKPRIYIYFNKENNERSPKFKVGCDVRIPKYKNIFAKGYVPYCSEEVFVIDVPQIYVISILTEKKLLELIKKMNNKKQIKRYLQMDK